jgi:hypothetical protein
MWPFGRNKDSNLGGLPPEVNAYYESENRDRASIAWLVGLTSLVVTVGLALGIFFGGRWAYRQLRSDNAPTVATNGQTGGQVTPPSTDSSTVVPDASPAPTPTPAPQPTPSPTPSPTPAPTPTPQSTPQPTPTPTPAVAAATDTKALTSTGPADTLKIFLAVTVLAGFGHYTINKRKLAKL